MTPPTITLLPQVGGSDLPEIPLALIAGDQPTIACDCYVVGIEQHGTLAPWGWRYGIHENIDHHAPVDAMARVVSSANLALLRVASEGPVSTAARVLITHNDCDSILSSGIMAGRLAPDPRYGAAAIAADSSRPRATRERRGLRSGCTRCLSGTATGRCWLGDSAALTASRPPAGAGLRSGAEN